MKRRRTYWHLESLGRKPSDYEIATSRLLYHPERGFEVRASAAGWHERYQRESPLSCSDWDRFSDPRETTYAKYTAMQREKEIFVDGLLREIDETDYDRRLPERWVATLEQTLAPLRYPVHGLQMVASYVGSLAPSGKIAVAALFQAADEIRRVERLAYRMRQLQRRRPDFGERSRATWEDDPVWQPLREAIERLLVTRDWGESLVALNFVVKPVFDELFLVELGRIAREHEDVLLERILRSLYEDSLWQREWSLALARLAFEDRPGNREVFRSWVDRWRPLAERAVGAFEPVFGGAAGSRPGAFLPGILARALATDPW